MKDDDKNKPQLTAKTRRHKELVAGRYGLAIP